MSAPIGKFESGGVSGSNWSPVFAREALIEGSGNDDHPTLREDCRFRPNTYLKDAQGEYWLEGDEGWTPDGKKFTVVLQKGAFIAHYQDDEGFLCAINDVATHTPPKKKYKRYVGEIREGYIEVDNQRVGEAERRKLQLGAGEFALSLMFRVPNSKMRNGKPDRRTGKGA